jgi:hypothetical protein
MLVTDKSVVEINSPSKTQSVNENNSQDCEEGKATRGSASVLGHAYVSMMTSDPSFQRDNGSRGSTGNSNNTTSWWWW